MARSPGYPRWQTASGPHPAHEREKAEREARAPRDPLAAEPETRRVYRLRPATGVPHGVSERIRAGLDREQLEVVEGARGRALVIASAGSGKTRTIVAKLAHLVDSGVAPERIMLVTFTRRAAREMVARAEAACGVDLAGLTAGTFHAVCHRILREHGTAVGLPPGFTVLDPEDQSDLIAIARDQVLAGLEHRPSLPRPATIAGYVGLAAESGRELAEVVVEQNGRLADRTEVIAAIAARYAERKAAHCVCDYADLLVLVRRLLDEHPGVRRRLTDRYRWILVDELHDVNPIQSALVETLGEGGEVVAVADPDQSIYSWRGADPDVVDRFAADPATRVFPLQTNYRSSPEIVGLAQATLPNGNPYGKRLRAARAAGAPPPVIAHLGSVAEEAAFVTQRIADLLNEGREPGEIGVLYRAHHHSVDLQLALNAAGVEFELYSGGRFVESAHVKDVLAFCRIRLNPRDELAWHRALRLFERVGPATASRLAARLSAAEDPLAAAIGLVGEGGPAASSLARFAGAVAAIAATDDPARIVLSVARSDWYRDRLRTGWANWLDREGDLARLAELAARARDLAGFLADLQLAERVESDEDISGPARRVALSTVHQAKGLEWPVVFVLQVEPGSFPSGWAISEGNLAEEERLFYVAVTRAADELYLCRPIAARRPWDTGADAVVINSGLGFLDGDLTGLVEEWSVRA